MTLIMHLDTVFTQIDYDKFTVHPGILGPLEVFKITPGDACGKVNIVRFKNTNHHAYIFGMNADDMTQCHFQARIGFAD